MSFSQFPFLSGGGQMGELVRQKDWGQTSLGMPGQWPLALKHTVSLLLRAKFPMLLFWGLDATQVYNDAYGQSLTSEQFPSWLGKPGAACWGQQWLTVASEIAHVMKTGKASTRHDQSVKLYQEGSAVDACWTYSFNPVVDESGEHQGVLLICSDTAPAATATPKSEEAQGQVLAFFEQSPVGIAIFDRERLVFRMANPFYCYLIGRTREQIVGKPLFEALPELAGQGFEYLLDQVFITGEPYIAREVQVKLIRNNRMETFYVDLTYQPRREADGQISGILVVCTEVTQQVLSRKQIEDSESILRDMILNAPIGICLLNADDLVSEIVNDSFLEVAGKAYQEIIGKNYWVPFAEAAPYYEASLDAVVRDGVPFFANEVPLMLIRHGKKENIFVTFVYMPLIDAGGKVRKVVVWVLENTHQVLERRKIEEIVHERTQELSIANEQLKESNELLRQSNENLERFAHVASHDLQEPLRKILTFGNLLRPDGKIGNTKGEHYLDRMLAAAQRMSSQIRDLLEFSKISHQRALPVPLSLNQVVAQVLVTLESEILESKAKFITDELPEILADPMQMDQLFQNLLSNAIKFRKPDQPPVVQIRCQLVAGGDVPPTVIPSRQADRFFHIEVEDNGIGFDEQYKTRIFQMFQRLHAKQEFSGTGIGLAIAEKVAVNHGGALTARSQPGHGAIFSIFLPVDNDFQID